MRPLAPVVPAEAPSFVQAIQPMVCTCARYHTSYSFASSPVRRTSTASMRFPLPVVPA